jgi:adenylosuccinate lyase
MMAKLTELSAISPIDGRYRGKTEVLSNYFSEYALIKYRVQVEIEYFIALCELPLPQLKSVSKNKWKDLRNIYLKFSETDAQEIKNTEKVTNHDVKAVEYFIKKKMDELKLGAYKEFVHFGLTSQDINNTAIPLSIKLFTEQEYLPKIISLISQIEILAKEWKNIPMLAHTHGQPASPTKLGKEMMVFVERLQNQVKQLKSIAHSGKFGGATGNMNAHFVAYPKTDWIKFANNFMKNSLGIDRQKHTTQIEHYDNMAAIFDAQKRINTILLDFSKDMWAYISMEYFKQKINKNEVGSSAMPHKVNPIDFENAEGNLGLANALLEHLSAKLPVSRLQRDLTDSTVTRNIGVPYGHILIAFSSLEKGLSKLLLNPKAIENALDKNCIVVAEAIQTVLRREGYTNPYEKLKELTRTNESITMKLIHEFVDTLDVKKELKAELKKITPHNYVGKS